MKELSTTTICYQCDFCDKVFNSIASCEKHQRHCDGNAQDLIPCMRLVFIYEQLSADVRHPESAYSVTPLTHDSKQLIYAREQSPDTKDTYGHYLIVAMEGDPPGICAPRVPSRFRKFGEVIGYSYATWRSIYGYNAVSDSAVYAMAYIRNLEDYEAAVTGFKQSVKDVYISPLHRSLQLRLDNNELIKLPVYLKNQVGELENTK